MSTDHTKKLEALLTELRKNVTSTIMFHQAIATQLGLGPTDHKCLEYVLENPDITAGKIAEYTGLTTGAVTGVIDRLEKVGFVSREADPNDRRRTIIRINYEKAEQGVYPLFGSFGEEITKVLSTYNEKELEFLTDFIVKINEVLEKETERISKSKSEN